MALPSMSFCPTIVFMGIYFTLSKFYLGALFAHLNARKRLKDTSVGYRSIHLSKIPQARSADGE
ncbi:hypothetical protein NEOLEDRAFT_1130884 [Neolentinus lepideus HHB14362 ss-1]|uniref:Uncharacterized protein n=1 Tax=Neolentinus lepideus HHB14362 ss-1 TaxID=1314782 RepID=A0A165TY73_9AGAM|nr:hypothetical protein NEOLEDRAFT_1130884 [Neolentinus lepideus HHB14362 ss-1]